VDAQERATGALRRVAYLLERTLEPTYRVRAFRTAAATLDDLSAAEVEQRAAAGTLKELSGVGDVTAKVVTQAVAGQVPDYLAKLEAEAEVPLATGGEDLLAALRGDLHMHSDWSDGGSPIREMVLAARDLGHEYVALTDHSPRLTVANGLSPERLRRQLDIVEALNEELAPFRVLTGIEVDINEDGTLDQEPELLERLDVVVASVHSKLRMPSAYMTPRMVAAVANPAVDVLGHCTGRMGMARGGGEGRGRPESEFDAEIVFEACRQFGVAVEVNCRPERQDPPERLIEMAVATGCLFSVDTDAHAPGQLEWQEYGCARAAPCGVDPAQVIDTWPLADLVAHGHRHE
jgi:putative hydrolase